jgi:threonine aldolase
MTIDLTPPGVSFASDNSAGVHPAVMEALAEANHAHAMAYGADRWTARLGPAMSEVFGRPVEVLPVWGGTGANLVGLASLLGGTGAIVCTEHAHLHVDEGGAPERLLGAKVLALPAPDGKLRPEQLRQHAHWLGDEHHPQPRVVSLTQATELGTVYTPEEVAAVAAEAHRLGMLVHVDGARLANAAAHLSGDVRAFTVGAGVDVISFGGTKNGMMYGEAVVFCDPARVGPARFLRKQLTQLPSKARFISAQLLALLEGGRWLELAAHANAMARRLHDQVRHCPDLVAGPVPQANSMFPVLPRPAIEELRAWCPFYDWDLATVQVRWMTAWDTTEADVDGFAKGVRAVLGG